MKHALIFAAIAFVSLPVHANPTQVSNGVMASKDGKTLYTFDKDASGKSTLQIGSCATAWPPFIAANPDLAGGDFSIVKRDDGAAQWAQGQPLYFAGDAKAGDATATSKEVYGT